MWALYADGRILVGYFHTREEAEAYLTTRKKFESDESNYEINYKKFE